MEVAGEEAAVATYLRILNHAGYADSGPARGFVARGMAWS